MKYTPERVKRIYDLFSSGQHTIQQICDAVDISKETYFTWIKEKADFSDLMKSAESERLYSFREMALSGLAKLLQGYTYEEVTTEKGVVTKTVTKQVQPNITAIIFTATNTYSERFSRNEPAKNDTKIMPPVREIEDATDIE